MEHFIKNIEITNFKSIRHAEVKDCRRVNVFVGPPNVGKSNILEALSGFSLLSKSNSVNLQELVRFKDVSDLFFNGNTSTFSEISLNESLFLNFHFLSVNSINIEITNERAESIGILSAFVEKYYASVFSNGRHLEKINLADSKEYENSFGDWEVKDQVIKVKKYGYKNEFDYISSQDSSLIIPFGNNLKDILRTNSKLKSEVVSHLNVYKMKLLFDKSDNDLRVIRFLDDETVFSLSIDLVADTLKRLIFFKACILSNKNAILLFEEPEAHCYEPYILEFTNTVKRDQNNNQFFIVTHSQYVIEELLRDEDSRNNTNIYLVGLENNETKVKLLGPEINKEIYQTGLNVFFNYQSLWNEMSEHEAVH